MKRGSPVVIAWACLDVLVCAAIIAVSLHALSPYYWAALTGPWEPSFWTVLPETAAAACRVWAFWGLGTLLGAAVLLRWAPTFSLGEALFGGALLVWIAAYGVGELLGPIALLRSWVVWLLLGILAVVVLEHPPRRWPQWRWSTGQGLTLLTLLLVIPGTFLVQLGSPVPPHFDVWAPAAAAQHVVTFGGYWPEASDPYGYYGPIAGCPGMDLLYALLALGGGLPLAVLAETAAIVPLLVLLVLAVARLGKVLGGDRAGGFAALLVCATVFVRMLPTGHGRYVVFVLVAAGLAFFCDPRRHPVRLILGALCLGTAVAAHALIGAFGMLVAAGMVACWLLVDAYAAAFAGTGLLAGASLWAFPTVAAGISLAIPYPGLPLIQFVGLLLMIVAASWMPARPAPETRSLLLLAIVAALALVWSLPSIGSVLRDHWALRRFPLLCVLGAGGLLVVFFARVQRGPLVVLALVGIAVEAVGVTWQHTATEPRLAIALYDFLYKVYFWWPFALLFPAAVLLAVLARWCGTRLVTYALLCALAFPWRYGQPQVGTRDPNYQQHALVESWAEQVLVARHGYWASTGHRRWAQSAAEFALFDVLRAEIAAGRITRTTHLVHLTPYVILYQDVALPAVFTGITEDLYVAGYVWDRSNAAGRFYPAAKVHEALATRPPYVLIHDRTLNGATLQTSFPDALALDGYTTLFTRDGIRLLRRNA